MKSLDYIYAAIGLIIAIGLLFVPSEQNKTKTVLVVLLIFLFLVSSVINIILQNRADKESQENHDAILNAIKDLAGFDKEKVTAFGSEMEDGRLYFYQETNGIKHQFFKDRGILYMKTEYLDHATGTVILKLINGKLEPIDISLPYPITQYQIIFPAEIATKNESQTDDGTLVHKYYFKKGGNITFRTKDGQLVSVPERVGGNVNMSIQNGDRKIIITVSD